MKAVDIVGLEGVSGNDLLPYLVEVELVGDRTDAFRKVRETLERIGVVNTKNVATLYQSCHILSKQNKYYIVHFKSLYVLDGKDNCLTQEDIARQNKIALMLQEWNMLKIVNPDMVDTPVANLSDIKVVRFSERDKWVLQPKYRLGNSTKYQKAA